MTESSTQAQLDRSAEPMRATRARRGRGRPAVFATVFVVPVCVISVLMGQTGAAMAKAPESADLEVTVSGVLDAPVAEVWRVLLDLPGFADWYPATGDWQVLERGTKTALVYGHQKLPWPIRDRHYVVRYRWWARGLNEFLLEARATDDPVPRGHSGRRRVHRMRTLWHLRAEGESTHVRYTYSGETGGPLPRWVNELGWQRGAQAVITSLRGEVEQRRQSEQQVPSADVDALSEAPRRLDPEAGAEEGDAKCDAC